MKRFMVIVLTFVVISLNVTNVFAVQLNLFDWGLNVDGTAVLPGGSLPGFVNASAFDFTTGLGTLSLTISGAGSHSILGFFDHEIDEPVNTFFNETGTAHGNAAAGQSWEIDEPGYVSGNIYNNFLANSLDNSIGTVGPDDISMAMGWDLVLLASEYAIISFVLSDTAPTSGFYLEHTDPHSGASIFLSSTSTVVPEPSTVLLVGIGLVGLVFLPMKKRHINRGQQNLKRPY